MIVKSNNSINLSISEFKKFYDLSIKFNQVGFPFLENFEEKWRKEQ